MINQKVMSFEEMQDLSVNIRLYLIINLIATLFLCFQVINIFWEKAGEFTDLFVTILYKMLPFLTFVVMFMGTFVLIFYMIGIHHVNFDFHSEENFDDWNNGIVKECSVMYETNSTSTVQRDGKPFNITVPHFVCETDASRIDDILGDAKEANNEEVPYDNIFQAFLFVYQMFLGDATPEFFAAFKAKVRNSATMYVLWLFYIPISFLLLVVLLNMLIAIMGDAQSSRTEHGRAIIY